MAKWTWLLLLLAVVMTSSVVSAKKEKCTKELQECNESDYQSYVECIRKRSKRSLDCAYEEECHGSDCHTQVCDGCDCNYCETHSCESSCSSCCESRQVCTTHHCCHKRCHSECKTSSCRSSCRRRCTNKIPINGGGGGGGDGSGSGSLSSRNAHNITTIINLHSNISMPVTVNNTVNTNITMNSNTTTDHNISGGGGGGNYPPGQIIMPPYPPLPPYPRPPTTQPQPTPPGGNWPYPYPPIYPPVYPQLPNYPHGCCNVISPRRCAPQPSPPFFKCFHLRSKKCGSICSAPIMHEHPHQICDEGQGEMGCHEQVVYIPQPQPRCWSTSNWPYVNCGLNTNTNCEGCYSGEKTSSCSSSCYDEGYGYGPLYRQGPFYQAGMSPYPSCMLTGTCGMMGGGYPTPYAIPGLGFDPSIYENSELIQADASQFNSTNAIPAPPIMPLPYPMGGQMMGGPMMGGQMMGGPMMGGPMMGGPMMGGPMMGGPMMGGPMMGGPMMGGPMMGGPMMGGPMMGNPWEYGIGHRNSKIDSSNQEEHVIEPNETTPAIPYRPPPVVRLEVEVEKTNNKQAPQAQVSIEKEANK